MGTPDTINIKCLNCKVITTSQTKLDGENMDSLEMGEKFCFTDCILLLKDKCHKCKSKLAVKIKGNRLIKTVNPKKATIQELPWTSFKPWKVRERGEK